MKNFKFNNIPDFSKKSFDLRDYFIRIVVEVENIVCPSHIIS